MGGDGPEQTLGERIAAERSAQGKAARLASSLARFAHTAGPRAVAQQTPGKDGKKGDGQRKKAKRKHAPREISSLRAVPQGRYRCLGEEDDESDKRKAAFDPRFSEHCGTLLEGHADRNFSFLENMVDSERYHKEELLKKRPEDFELAAEVRSLKASISRRETELKRKDLETRMRKHEKELVKSGVKKNPFFHKKKDIRELEMQERFHALKQTGGVKKYIEKKRRRAAAKDRKKLVERR